MAGRTRIALGLVVVLGAMVAAGCQQAATPTGQEAVEPPAAQDARLAAIPAEGEPAVTIKAYYPFNEDHIFIAEYIREVAESHPGKVKVEFYDTQTPEGRRAWSTTGLNCAGVFVNGETKWEVEKDGETEEVEFLKRLDVFWQRDDFKAVVDRLVEEAETAA